jgi:hypothetical protein
MITEISDEDDDEDEEGVCKNNGIMVVLSRISKTGFESLSELTKRL